MTGPAMAGHDPASTEYTGKHRRDGGLGAVGPPRWGNSTPARRSGAEPDGRLMPGRTPAPDWTPVRGRGPVPGRTPVPDWTPVPGRTPRPGPRPGPRGDAGPRPETGRWADAD